MKRDLSERLESAIIGSNAVQRAVRPIDTWLNRLFQSKALHPVKLLGNGGWLGHPLHPLLTDVPVGAWTVAVLLDVAALFLRVDTGRAASAAIGLGILAAVGAAGTGLMDWLDVNPPEKAVGAVHAVSNSSATVLFGVSLAMRAQNLWRATPGSFVVAILGYVLLTLGAYLGGSMVFRMGVMVNRNAYRGGPNDFASAIASTELTEGSPRKVMVGDEPVLLVRKGEQILAVGAVCSHYGAPLEEGKIVESAIECPWHSSRFELEDGRVRQGPACAPLPSYDVRVAGGQIQVRRRP
jgi:nitrite reductase/ring-hydroxylating ferredoxin subunit/uncharacterized membrane protein